jgi:hypothetical protein
MAATRRLAAILAADVAGYSRLMGADEEGTHERLRAHLQQVIPVGERYPPLDLTPQKQKVRTLRALVAQGAGGEAAGTDAFRGCAVERPHLTRTL